MDVLLADEDRKLLAYHRHDGDKANGVVVAMNLRAEPALDVALSLPAGGIWRLRLNADWPGYSRDFGDEAAFDLDASDGDGGDLSATLSIGAYSVLVFTR